MADVDSGITAVLPDNLFNFSDESSEAAATQAAPETIPTAVSTSASAATGVETAIAPSEELILGYPKSDVFRFGMYALAGVVAYYVIKKMK